MKRLGAVLATVAFLACASAGDLQFDASTNEDLVQISVPVRDGGRAIGAITVGVRMSSR